MNDKDLYNFSPVKCETPLIFVGGGGHCRSVLDTALRAGYDVRGIFDVVCEVGRSVMGVPVIGTDDDIERLVAEGCRMVVTMGAVGPSTRWSRRIALHERLASLGALATIVAGSAVVSPWAEIGEGSVVLEGCHIGPMARIGAGCIINTGANIEHDAVIGALCHVATGAVVNGGCQVGERCFIGSHATVAQGVELPGDTVVAASSFLLGTLREPGTYGGVPARRLDRRPG